MSQAHSPLIELVIAGKAYQLLTVSMQNGTAVLNLAAHVLEPGTYPVQRIPAPVEHADHVGDWLVLVDAPTEVIIGASEAKLSKEKGFHIKHGILEPWVTVREKVSA